LKVNDENSRIRIQDPDPGSGSGSESGSISQRHGSADPDPDQYQNVMNPQHSISMFFFYCQLYFFSGSSLYIFYQFSYEVFCNLSIRVLRTVFRAEKVLPWDISRNFLHTFCILHRWTSSQSLWNWEIVLSIYTVGAQSIARLRQNYDHWLNSISGHRCPRKLCFFCLNDLWWDNSLKC